MSAGYLYAEPIVVAMPAHVRGAVVAHTAGYAYDYFSESSASSSSSYQQNGGAGGNQDFYAAPGIYTVRGKRVDYNAIAGSRGPCAPGYVLNKVKGKWICVRKTSKKSRSR